jgi:pimeloyl-ACP methyl ester carboxylesterase
VSAAALPVLYLLPGLLSDQAVWQAQRDALAQYAEVRIPVFRGFASFREMALHVLKDAPPRFSVAGHSMGGRVALELMHLFPERIDRFALLSVGAHPLLPGEFEKRMTSVELAEREGMEALADVWIPPMVHPLRCHDRGLLRAIRAMLLRNTVADYRGQIMAALNRPDQSLYLPAIRHKVLLLVGEQDEWSPPSQHQNIKRRLRDCELHVIRNAGHMVTMEQPEAVNKLLLGWFAAGR